MINALSIAPILSSTMKNRSESKRHACLSVSKLPLKHIHRFRISGQFHHPSGKTCLISKLIPRHLGNAVTLKYNYTIFGSSKMQFINQEQSSHHISFKVLPLYACLLGYWLK